jgi:hypothetical protein
LIAAAIARIWSGVVPQHPPSGKLFVFHKESPTAGSSSEDDPAIATFRSHRAIDRFIEKERRHSRAERIFIPEMFETHFGCADSISKKTRIEIL